MVQSTAHHVTTATISTLVVIHNPVSSSNAHVAMAHRQQVQTVHPMVQQYVSLAMPATAYRAANVWNSHVLVPVEWQQLLLMALVSAMAPRSVCLAMQRTMLQMKLRQIMY